MTKTSIDDATHVVLADGRVEKIREKWGIDRNGVAKPPSAGGFGVTTESGRRVSMWNAMGYYKEDG